MNYYPNTWRGVPRGTGPPEVRGPMQPHRLYRLKAALAVQCRLHHLKAIVGVGQYSLHVVSSTSTERLVRKCV